MKSSSNKEELKGLIKECVREVIFEDGIVSNLVSEIAAGFVKANLLESRVTEKRTTVTERVMEQKKQEPRKESQSNKQLKESLKKIYGGIDLFEGTTPIAAERSAMDYSPLSGTDSKDSGVDITNIPGMKNWSKLI